MPNEATFFQMTGITKAYWMGDEWQPVLRGIDFDDDVTTLAVMAPAVRAKAR